MLDLPENSACCLASLTVPGTRTAVSQGPRVLDQSLGVTFLIPPSTTQDCPPPHLRGRLRALALCCPKGVSKQLLSPPAAFRVTPTSVQTRHVTPALAGL